MDDVPAGSVADFVLPFPSSGAYSWHWEAAMQSTVCVVQSMHYFWS